jgi:hypothetical protein
MPPKGESRFLDSAARRSNSQQKGWCVSKTRPHECTCIGKGTTAIFQMSIPQWPRMNHVWPNLQNHCDLNRPGARGKSSGVIEQCFVRTNLD